MDTNANKPASWFANHKRILLRVIAIVVAVVILFYGFLIFLSYRAADLFNYVVRERQLFPGNVTISRISATPWGRVYFNDLRWESEEGLLLADIPEGTFKVKILDIVRMKIGTQTVTDLIVNKGYIHLVLDKNMELVGVKSSHESEPKNNDKKKTNTIKITGVNGNRPFDCHVEFRNGTIEAEAPNRHFVMERVNMKADIHTRDTTSFNLSAGGFTGTVAANGLRLGGKINFAPDVPTYNLYLNISDCNPNSLGVGMNITDPASIDAKIHGDLPHPVIDGILSWKELKLPGIAFNNLKGDIHYEDGKLTASDVTAVAYDGDVTANGYFDLDEHAYEADAHGEKLKGSLAAHDMMLVCDVTLDLHMGENKSKRTKVIRGSFYSGKGKYHLIPFNGIKGSFEQLKDELIFRDVVISFAAGDVKTDAFSIIDGKVHLGTIYLDNGQDILKVR